METKQELGYSPESWTRALNWKWYKHQMTGWSHQSYWLLAIGSLILTYTGLMLGVNPMSVLTTISSLLGWVCVLSIVENRAINGITAAIQVMLLVYVSIVTTNYSEIIMQLTYLVLLDIPVLFKWKDGDQSTISPTWKKFGKSLIWFVSAWAILYIFDTQILVSQRPILDAATASLGVTGAILTVEKEDLSFVYWLGGSVASITLWIHTSLTSPHPMWVLALMYACYLGNNFNAILSPGNSWFKKMKRKMYKNYKF